MIYGVECWPIKKQHVHKSIDENLRWMCGKASKESEMGTFKELEVASIGDKLRVTCLRWFGHVQQRPALLRKRFSMWVDDPPKKRDGWKRTWMGDGWKWQ